MTKLLAATTAFLLLTGCGATGLQPAAPTRAGLAQASSLAGVKAGVQALLERTFVLTDKDADGALTRGELASEYFDVFDADRDGRVLLREYANPRAVRNEVERHRHAAGTWFAMLDVDGDRLLRGEEIGRTSLRLLAGDVDHNGKINLSEFEDVFAATVGREPIRFTEYGGELGKCPAQEPALTPTLGTAEHGRYNALLLPSGWDRMPDELSITNRILNMKNQPDALACFAKFYPGAFALAGELAP